jgi:very-short-patch-repair endonuclease
MAELLSNPKVIRIRLSVLDYFCGGRVIFTHPLTPSLRSGRGKNSIHPPPNPSLRSGRGNTEEFMKYPEIKEIAKRLRKNQTPEEKLLWNELRNKKLEGFRFLRQHPLYYEHVDNDHFFFVPDFYCAELRLIIELDGGVHLNQKERDEKRDLIMQSYGFKILRINNEEMSDPQKVKEKIIDYINREYS